MAAVQRALWYIESHSGQALALTDVARAAGVSTFHLSRLFQTGTGWSVVKYLRMRRLSQAAATLAAGATDILDVALSAGYGSHEAFTRAFGDAFGKTPEEVRKQASLDGVDAVSPLRVIEEPAPVLAALRIETIGPLLLAGISHAYRASDTAGIPGSGNVCSISTPIAFRPRRRTACSWQATTTAAWSTSPATPYRASRRPCLATTRYGWRSDAMPS